MKSAREYFSDAERLEEQGKYKDAINVLDKAISKDKNFIGSYINRGADKSALGDYIGAIEDYMKVSALTPKTLYHCLILVTTINDLTTINQQSFITTKLLQQRAAKEFI